MIYEYLFGLVTCYSEMGVCNISGLTYDFNPMIVPILYMIGVLLVLLFLLGIFYTYQQFRIGEKP
jgi:hypothetical protein